MGGGGVRGGKGKTGFFGRKLTLIGHLLHNSHQIYNVLYTDIWRKCMCGESFLQSQTSTQYVE